MTRSVAGMSTRVGWACLLLWIGAQALASSGAVPDEGTMGYVLASYDYLFHKTPGAREECPAGLNPTNREQWEAQFPTEDERRAHLEACLADTNRGPNCENVWVNPTAVEDPLPFRAVTGTTSYGIDLDGTDGEATASTCAHENFVSPSGETGVDNQYYRFFGCERFVQGGQHHAPENAVIRTAQYQVNRVLLLLSGVDSLENDDSVQVTMYRGKDPLLLDGAQTAVPWQTQRVDHSIPPVRLDGRIVDGELTTSPKDVFWEGVLFERRLLLRGMVLKLKLDDVRAEGLRLGYVDVDRLWQSYSQTAKWGGGIYGGSGPSAYRAMHDLADGYKDPGTGRCTGLSSARRLELVRAHIVDVAGEGTE